MNQLSDEHLSDVTVYRIRLYSVTSRWINTKYCATYEEANKKAVRWINRYKGRAAVIHKVDYQFVVLKKGEE